MFTLEICCYNYQSCFVAAGNGANRIELCADAAEGGTTPGFGTIKLVKEKLNVELYPIIRPRGGDFLYTEEEFFIMQSEILLCKELGCDGVVFGMLTADGSIDKDRCRQLVQAAYPMGATFHRAFDRANNPFEAMEDIIACGFERILSSGHKPNATEGAPLLGDLVRQANDRIAIMPGSGVRAANITALVKSTSATEFHSSASIKVPGGMQFFNPGMNESLQHVIADEKEVKGMREALDESHNG